MKRTILFAIITFSSLSAAQAQKSSKVYAITGKSNNNFFWADIKQIDINTGKVVKTLFEADKTVFKTVQSGKSKVANQDVTRPTDQSDKSKLANQDVTRPTEFGVAACAFDARHNRLYFAPMHFADIRFLNLDKEEATFSTVRKNVISTPVVNGYQTEENQITRMVIAADGFGYALTNDANHLIRFSTGKNAIVDDLGSLIDASSNTGFSVHNKCTSWGGDMLADAFGKLVVISASHSVYTFDALSKIATYKGAITGLPANYTTNGAVVDDEGNIVLSSANVFEGLYKCNYKDMVAVKVPGGDETFNASDLANGNFLLQKEADAANKFDITKQILADYTIAAEAKVYPNPAAGNQFNLLFEKQQPGKYTILFTDLAGRAVSSKVVNIVTGMQTVAFNAGKSARGTYLVKVISENKQVAFSERVILQ